MSHKDKKVAPGTEIHGFRVESVTPLPAMRSAALVFTHVRTGARVLHLHNDDPENLFSVSFPTPPPDDTGMPHILEHAVLAGSKKYPIREPFFELVKMSMATFINAMTGYDCTYYPVTSNVPRDLFNLADVYLDALFNPLLTDLTLMQEGHHLVPADPAKPTGALSLSGVVYNEMKGLWSNPESKLARLAIRRLLPDTIYGLESGGLPEAIPSLKWKTLREFRAARYHPSNAFFIFYGNIPSTDYLSFLEPQLAPFHPHPLLFSVPPQPRWTSPRRIEEPYSVERSETLTSKTFLAVQWLVGNLLDPKEAVRLHVLNLLLLGNEAAPLRKALIDSHLGQDLTMAGDGAAGAEATFHIGLKGSEADREAAFVELVLETLRDLAAKGFDAERVQAAFQQTSYFYLEVLPQFPLHVMDRVLTTWLYGADPLAYLRLPDHLQAVREEWERNPRCFCDVIQTRLLDNPHRLTIVLRPDGNLQRREDRAQTERMAALRAGLTDEQTAAIAQRAAEVQESAGKPNSPEDLAALPQLKLADLPPTPLRIPTATQSLKSGNTFLRHDVFSNGVNYLHLHFNLLGLPADLWPFLPRYADAVAKMGAAGFTFEQMAHRLSACTGGIRCATDLRTSAADPSVPVWGLRLSLRALDEQIEPALDVLGDIVFGVDPHDRIRLRDVLTQSRARYRHDLVANGHSTALTHASRGLTAEAFLADRLSGVPQLDLAEDLADRFEDRAPGVIAAVAAIRDFILARARVTASFTGSDAAADAVKRRLTVWLDRMNPGAPTAAPVGFSPSAEGRREGLAAPSEVTYACRVMPAPHLSSADEVLLTLGAQLLEFDYLLPEIRFKGNAYGVYCMYDPHARRLAWLSYRDPSPGRTIAVFDRVPDFVKSAQWSDADLHRIIISTAKNDFPPLRPGEVTGLGLQRFLTGFTPERQAARYERLKSATTKAVKQCLLSCVENGRAHSSVCVVGSRETLQSIAGLEIRDIRK
jgi:Zn-dependent M16 (insulinase) family peptidase